LKRLPFLLLLLSLATSAHATGVGLRWGSCEGTSNRNFACDRSTGQEMLVATFQPPGYINQLTGVEAILRITSANGDAPSWWQMYKTGSCRRTSATLSFDVSDQFECDNPWSTQAMGGLARWESDGSGVNVWLTGAIPANEGQSVNSGTTYAAFKLMINHQKSSGAGACSGCDTPVCIKLEAITLCHVDFDHKKPDNTYDSKTWELTQGINGLGGAAEVATWQGGTSTCAAGLAKPSTWSELKARFKSK